MDHDPISTTTVFALSYPCPCPTMTTAPMMLLAFPREARMSQGLGSGLPNEILDTIFDHLSRDALTRVALVSHRWRANAERLLYASIVIHEVLPRASPSPSPSPSTSPSSSPSPVPVPMFMSAISPSHRPWHAAWTTIPALPATTLRCCETLAARTHLAAYVRHFHVRWETDAVESPLFLLPIARNISRTLVPTLVNLNSLELSFGLASYLPALTLITLPPPLVPLDPPPLSTTPSPPLPASPPLSPQTQSQSGQSYDAQCEYHHPLPAFFCLPSLRTLALHGLPEPPTLELERVLRLHPSLLHLRLSDYQRPLRLTPTDVPHLRSFRGHPATAASILPGRPVQSLGLVGCGGSPPPSEEELARIARGSTPVRALDLSGMSVTPTLLRSLSRHLFHVEWLRVRLALRHTLHYALSGMRLLTALTTALASFYNLRGLDLSPTSAVSAHHHHHIASMTTAAASDGKKNALEEQHLCVTWMGACPSLRRVVFPSRTVWWLSEAGTWISGSSGSLDVPVPAPRPATSVGGMLTWSNSSHSYPTSLIRTTG